MKLITVIGRGGSGTRIMSHTLRESGVFMGDKLNRSGDLVPGEEMYEACRVIARHVPYRGNLKWDFSKLHSMPIDPSFVRLIESYLSSVLHSESAHCGWKIPETVLVYPWMVRMLSDAYYIHWIRDPRDVILNGHITDKLAEFCVDCPKTNNIFEQRAISWKYQNQIVASTPQPDHFIQVRFEDMVLRQEETLNRLEDFLNIPLARIKMRKGRVGCFNNVKNIEAVLKDELGVYGYQYNLGSGSFW